MMGTRRQIRGSTSVFFCLILLIVSSLLFTLLEGARIEGLKANVRMNSDLVTESILAEYVTPLWENYHLFAGDDTDIIAAKAQVLGEENLSWQESTGRGLWLYPLHLQRATVTEYRILTDDGGEGFYQQIVQYMEQNLAKDAAETIYHKIEDMQDTSEEAGDMDQKVDDAKSCVEQAKEQQEEETEGTGEANPVTSENLVEAETVENPEEIENPLDYIGTWKSTAILTLLGADGDTLSNKGVNLEDSLENRKRQEGNWTKKEAENGWYDRVLFQEYLLRQFSTYATEAEQADTNEKNLEYEIEYLIAGKKSDKQNLESVLERILLLREAANFIYLQTDEAKKSKALTVATLLVGATGNVLLIKGVQQGILAVWAFAESVSDVKSLLAGEKIPIIKTASEWSTDVGALSEDCKFQKAEECENGLSYEDYLRVLLFLSDKTKLCYRAMDLMEWTVQETDGYSEFRMDKVWDKCTIQYDYNAKPLFYSVGMNDYQWQIQKQASYLTE